MPIEFEKARVVLDEQFLEKIREIKESSERAVNGLLSGNITDGLEALRLAVQLGKAGLSIGSMMEYLDREEREREVFIEEQDRRVIAALEHAGVDLTGIVDRRESGNDIQEDTPGVNTGSNAGKHTGSESETDETGEAEKKRRGVARIRANMGNLEAFKTGDPEVDKRFLEAPLDSFFGVGGGMTGGFCLKFALDRKPLIHDLLSHLPEEIVPARNWGTKRFEKILEALYEKDIVPDEKWDYFNVADEFMMESGMLLSEDAAKAFRNAVLEAGETGTSYVGSEHLFLGLIRDEGSIRKRITEDYGVDLSQIKEKINKLLNREPLRPPLRIRSILLTERARRILDKANGVRLALKLGAMSTEQILEALLEEEEGIVAKVLHPGDSSEYLPTGEID